MKFEKNNKIIAIILIPFLIAFAIFDILFILSETKGINEICSIITLSIICPILVLVILNSFKDKTVKDKFTDGEKITGFIVSTFKYKYKFGRNNYRTSYGLKVLANNKIYITDRLENNEYYKTIENRLNNIQVSGDIISFEKIPVDVYLKNNDYYVDIESINI